MKVLVVDGHQADRDLLCHHIRSLGYEATVATNADEALNLYTEERPNLVFIDVSKPVTDGYNTCRQIKGISFDKFVPIIFLTSHNDTPESLLTIVDAGGDDYISKPVSVPVLETKIQLMQKINSRQDSCKYIFNYIQLL